MAPRGERTPDGDDLRAALARGETVLMPGVWDPLSARLARDAGFSTVFLSGYCVAATHLGLPDIGLLTQTEMAEVARRVCRAVPELVVVVDADTGYGDASNTIRTVQLWEEAGAAGLFLEDQVWPKRCGHLEGKQVVPRDEWLAKLRAALAHRESLFVTARTDARAPLGLDEAIERARLAADLGVDAVFVEAPESLAELEQIASSLGGEGVVLVANMVETGRTPLLSASELHELGFDLIVSPLSGLFSMVHALRDAFRRLAGAGTLRDDLSGLATFEELTALLGLDRWDRAARAARAGDPPAAR